jgi:hypothetical protein
MEYFADDEFFSPPVFNILQALCGGGSNELATFLWKQQSWEDGE